MGRIAARVPGADRGRDRTNYKRDDERNRARVEDTVTAKQKYDFALARIDTVGKMRYGNPFPAAVDAFRGKGKKRPPESETFSRTRDTERPSRCRKYVFTKSHAYVPRRARRQPSFKNIAASGPPPDRTNYRRDDDTYPHTHTSRERFVKHAHTRAHTTRIIHTFPLPPLRGRFLLSFDPAPAQRLVIRLVLRAFHSSPPRPFHGR